MKTKAKLLSAAEARALVKAQAKALEKRAWRVSTLERLLEQTETQRAALKGLVDGYVQESLKMRSDLIAARADLKAAERSFTNAVGVAAERQARLDVYEAESAFQIWKRAMRKLGSTCVQRIRSIAKVYRAFSL